MPTTLRPVTRLSAPAMLPSPVRGDLLASRGPRGPPASGAEAEHAGKTRAGNRRSRTPGIARPSASLVGSIRRGDGGAMSPMRRPVSAGPERAALRRWANGRTRKRSAEQQARPASRDRVVIIRNSRPGKISEIGEKGARRQPSTPLPTKSGEDQVVGSEVQCPELPEPKFATLLLQVQPRVPGVGAVLHRADVGHRREEASQRRSALNATSAVSLEPFTNRPVRVG